MTDCGSKLPPGPPAKLLVGNLLDIDAGKLHHSFTDLSRQYGDIFTIHVSGKTTVVVNTIDAYRELYEEGSFGDSLCGRPRNFVTEYVYGEKDLPQCSNTPAYRVRREALYTSTKNVQQQHEERLYDALRRAVDYVTSQSRTQDLAIVVELYLTSIYLMALTGELYDYEDPRLRDVMERAKTIQEMILPKVTGVMTALPWLRGIPLGYGATYRRSLDLFAKLKGSIFDPLKASYDPEISRGGLDCLIRAQSEADPEMAGGLTDDYLWESASSTIGAGTGVGIGLILYFFVVVLHQPEIAEKVRAEIDSVIGRDRLPTLADKAAMLYTQAALMELFRWVSPAPLLVPRRLDSDIQFRDYSLPEDTSVITNAWKINHDEVTWDDPWEFKPQRFLGPDGQLREDQWNNVVVFGGGRRHCIGQSLARDVSFLFITAMLQKFTFEVPEGKKPPTLDPHHSVRSSAGIKPAPFTVNVNAR